jgi:HAD superfamily hydrolase (TIGR01509 family)
MIKACILDMDGVIVDTEPIQLEAFRLLLNEYEIHVSEEFLGSLVGYSIQDNMADIKEQFFDSKKFDIKSAITRRNNIYLQLISQQKLELLPGVMELILLCERENIKLALASSSDQQQVDTIMNRLVSRFQAVFDAVVTGDDVLNKKPAPDIYLRVVERLNLPPNSCLAFEDSRAGVESAKAAGVICFAIRNRYAEEKYLQKADRVINSIQEALEVVNVCFYESE